MNKSLKNIIRHDINPKLVDKTIKAQIKIYEKDKLRDKLDYKKTIEEYQQDKAEGNIKRWIKPPDSQSKFDKSIDSMYAKWIKKENEYYALVRIIEDLTKSNDEKRFYLVYGKDRDKAEGTGPFISKKEAAKWFLNQGR